MGTANQNNVTLRIDNAESLSYEEMDTNLTELKYVIVDTKTLESKSDSLDSRVGVIEDGLGTASSKDASFFELAGAIQEHENKEDPHSQYASKDKVELLSDPILTMLLIQ